ncbi:MAG: GNAT family N-acetyltransferase [Candidatus Nanopelagicales bacterium]
MSLRLAGADDRDVVERLAQLEQHDLSDITGELPGDDGRFDVALDRFFTGPGCAAYLIEDDGAPVGFALVRPVEGTAFVHSFFVVRSRRRRGLGAEAALALLATHDGRWTIAFVERYEAAARFWRAVATQYDGDTWTEQRRDHAGETFGWITLP